MTERPADSRRLDRLREVSRRIRKAALAAADPSAAVTRALAARDPGGPGRLFVLAVGKAAALMTAGALVTLQERGRHVHGGLVVQPHGYPASPSLEHFPGRVRSAGHPVPDADSLAAAAEAIALMEEMTETDSCLFLLSGGGSSLLSSPYPPLVLSDLAETNRLLLASGPGITEINTVRRHLSFVSGGRLAARSRGTVLTLAVSDVVGDDPSAVASGPSVADPTTFHDALGVLERKGLLARVPAGVRALLEAGAAGRVPETPKQLPGAAHVAPCRFGAGRRGGGRGGRARAGLHAAHPHDAPRRGSARGGPYARAGCAGRAGRARRACPARVPGRRGGNDGHRPWHGKGRPEPGACPFRCPGAGRCARRAAHLIRL